MENCFVLQLKGSVDNPNLEVLGQTKIIAKSTTKVSMWITSSVNQEICVKAPDGTVISTHSLSPDVRANIGVADMSSYDYVVYEIPDKYHITALYGHTTSELGGASDSTYTIKLSDFKWSLTILSASLIFEEEDFKEQEIVMPHLLADNYSMQIANYDYSINGYNGFYTITGLRRTSNYSSNISGIVERLLESFIKLGRNSGQFSIANYGAGFNASFNGYSMGFSVCDVTFTSDGCTVTPGVSFVNNCHCNGASYNKATGVWTYVPVE